MRTTAFVSASAAALLFTLTACNKPSSQAPANQTEAAKVSQLAARCQESQLKKLLDDYFTEAKVLNPMWATIIGDVKHHGQFSDGLSDAWLAKRHQVNTDFLARAQGVDTSCYSASQQLAINEFIRLRELALVGETFPARFLPFDQFSNPYSTLMQFASGKSAQPFATVVDFENFKTRAQGFEAWVNLAISRMNEGIESDVTLPRVLALRAAEQIRRTLAMPQSESPLWGALPLAMANETWTEQERQQITQLFQQSIEHHILPSLVKLADYIENDYLDKARATDGLWGLPNGRLWYKHFVNSYVDDSRTVEQIHQLGLAEVARIHEQMLRIGNTLDIGNDLPTIFAAMTTDDIHYFSSGDDLVDGYNELKLAINPVLDGYFAAKPAQDYEVREVEAYRAANAAGASYMMGSRDGTRPGIFYINTFNLRAQPKWGMVTLSLHEASPGHHFQIATQLSLPVLSEYQNYQSNGAFVEGWALYAEHLGLEMGLFNDPYDHFGKLSDELLRAMRLVVDTGLHDKGWTREQAINYMVNSSPLAKSDIVAEVERYMALPGQALSYKLGEQTILQLREQAEQQLGERFDIREFHDVVLRNGSISMPSLRLQIDEWLAQKENGS